MYHKLFPELTPDDVILTANRRLSAFLRGEYALYQQKTTAQQVWQPLDILPLTSWLERCWEKSQLCGQAPALTLLNNHQEQLLWEQIVAESEAGAGLLRINATAAMAYQAWQLTVQWHIDSNAPAFLQTENSQAWQLWAQRFQNICQENQWLDTATLLPWLAEQFSKNFLPAPKKLIVIGFDELSPRHQKFFATLRAQGTQVREFNAQQEKQSVQCLSLADQNTELVSMARWAFNLWQKGVSAIGCVIPNLADIRQEVLTTFSDIFAPETQLPGYYDNAVPFNISAGTKLNEMPLISIAFTLLALTNEVKLTQLGLILRSPYVGYGEQEMLARANLDAHLRSLGEPTLALHAVQVAAKKNGVTFFAALLESYLKLQRSIPAKLTLAEWAKLFAQQLTTLGWPGQRTLNSIEHQTLETWAKLLTQFAQLSLVTAPLNHSEALLHLQNLAAAQEFQPKTPAVPVQILGILEAGGLSFDKLWVMGLHDQAWPTAPNPNPFIPLSLQRDYQLPHSSSSRELSYCRTATNRLKHSAQQVIFSYPQQLGDLKLQPSPFLQAEKFISLTELELPPTISYAENIFASAQLEYLTDDYALPIAAQEKITGGSGIFKYQAACPFRAFARFRLGAQSLDEPDTGLSLQERGSILHKVLEALWLQLGDQQQLIHCTDADLAILIATALDKALAGFIQQRPLTFRKRFLAIEKMRLTRLLQNWLPQEINRPSFKVFTAEQAIKCTFAGIPLTLKADRIDQLADGSYLILDYKTGHPTRDDMLGERPNEPQLPLYCVTNEFPIAGVIFAKIRSNEQCFYGISATETNIRGVVTPAAIKAEDVPKSWNDLVFYWRSILTTLGQQFSHGYAKVDPKDGSKTCQTCDLRSLCRINSNC